MALCLLCYAIKKCLTLRVVSSVKTPCRLYMLQGIGHYRRRRNNNCRGRQNASHIPEISESNGIDRSEHICPIVGKAEKSRKGGCWSQRSRVSHDSNNTSSSYSELTQPHGSGTPSATESDPNVAYDLRLGGYAGTQVLHSHSVES